MGDGEVVVEEAGVDGIEARFVQTRRDRAGGALSLFQQRDGRVDGTGAGEGLGFGDPAVETVLSSASWSRLNREPEGAAGKAAQQLAAQRAGTCMRRSHSPADMERPSWET